MSREVKRVPLDFDWPIGMVWGGYWMPYHQIPCPDCRRHPGWTHEARVFMDSIPWNVEGQSSYLRAVDHFGSHEAMLCGTCDGEAGRWPTEEIAAAADAWERSHPPTGDGWQMWETTSDGSPMSPVMGTPEALARWLTDNEASAFGSATATYEQWLDMIGAGWAPSAALTEADGLVSGVDFVSSTSVSAQINEATR